MLSEAQIIMQSWMDAHSKQYIAHAVWADNVTKVLESGQVKPAEQILREKNTVSYESGGSPGARGSVSISHLLQGELLPSIPHCKNDYISLEKAKAYNFISAQETNEIIERVANGEAFPISISLADGKNYWVKYDNDNNLIIEGIPSLENFLSIDDEMKEYQKLINLHRTTSFELAIAIDSRSATPLDKELAQLFTIYKPLCLNGDWRNVLRALIELRSRLIPVHKLNREIHASYNSVFWAYGDVVVLRGKPDNILSISNLVRTVRDKTATTPTPFSEYLKRNLDYVFLRTPFENEGEFFSLDLADEDTLVIGPEKDLAPYRDSCKAKGVRLVAFEEMNHEQLKFLKVPVALWSEEQQACEKTLSTSSLEQPTQGTGDVDVVAEPATANQTAAKESEDTVVVTEPLGTTVTTQPQTVNTPKNELVKVQDKIELFKKIYNALYEGQTSFFKQKSDLILKPGLTEKDIENYVKDRPTSRTTKAWSLVQKHYKDSCRVEENEQLFTAIHRYSFKNSSSFGLFKRSENFPTNPYQDVKQKMANANPDSRTAKIVNALRR